MSDSIARRVLARHLSQRPAEEAAGPIRIHVDEVKIVEFAILRRIGELERLRTSLVAVGGETAALLERLRVLVERTRST